MKRITRLLNQFKEFAMQGNVIDLAVGLTVGAAFKDIVSSLVNDIVMPPIGYILGKVSFSNLYINLSSNKYETLNLAEQAGAPIIKYGNFLNTLIEFTIIAFTIFLIVKISNRLRAEFVKNQAKETTPKEKRCPYCFTKINIKATRCPNCTSKLDK